MSCLVSFERNNGCIKKRLRRFVIVSRKRQIQCKSAIITIIFNCFSLQPSRRSIKDLEIRLGEELGKILKYCQDSIPSCNARELGHTLKFLECVQALNNEIIKGTGSDDPNDDPEIAKIKRNNQIRHTHTDQTIRLINDQLLASILENKFRIFL